MNYLFFIALIFLYSCNEMDEATHYPNAPYATKEINNFGSFLKFDDELLKRFSGKGTITESFAVRHKNSGLCMSGHTNLEKKP